jgi:DnaJ-class molecular chaperone
MALKYHLDKNSEEGVADIFRRVKLAEVLGNDDTRFAYDAEQWRELIGDSFF